jgi:tRNA (mo5U34)-methyltransferase
VSPTFAPDEIRRRIAAHGRWFHEMELAPGVFTPGEDSNRRKLPILDELGLPRDARGLRVLDVGCSDGYFAFEMERRGASVVAVDFVPEGATGFAVAREILGSRVEYRCDNVYALDPARYGEFDVVLLLGVLYHLRKPLAALDAVRGVTKRGGRLFLATLLIDEFVLLPDGGTTRLADLHPALASIPLWQAYPRDSLNGDFTNCFAPNRRALEVALAEARFAVEGFRQVEMGGYLRARAIDDAEAERYERLDRRGERQPIDPEVPYFLDRDPAKRTLTGRRPPHAGGDGE